MKKKNKNKMNKPYTQEILRMMMMKKIYINLSVACSKRKISIATTT
jgi:hypothetical protein